MSDLRAGVVTTLGLTLVACSSRPVGTIAPPTMPFDAGAPAPPPCMTSGPAMPRAFIGPDLSLQAPCGGRSQGAVASVDVIGPGFTTWSAAVAGDPVFSPVDAIIRTCEATGPSVALILFTPPPTALPGDTFNAVVTIRADDDSFAPGTVNVQAEVIAPTIHVDPPSIDFGTVTSGAVQTQLLRFIGLPAGVSVFPPPNDYYFSFFPAASNPTSGTSTWAVDVVGDPGDHSIAKVWKAGVDVSLPEPCLWSGTVPMSAHIVPVSDGGAD